LHAVWSISETCVGLKQLLDSHVYNTIMHRKTDNLSAENLKKNSSSCSYALYLRSKMTLNVKSLTTFLLRGHRLEDYALRPFVGLSVCPVHANANLWQNKKLCYSCRNSWRLRQLYNCIRNCILKCSQYVKRRSTSLKSSKMKLVDTSHITFYYWSVVNST